MNKSIRTLNLIIIGLTLTIPVYPTSFWGFVTGTETYFGTATLTDKKFSNNLSMHGGGNLRNVSVQGSTTINGALTANNCTFTSLLVNGRMRMRKSTLTSDTTINGELEIEDSKCQNIIVNGYFDARNTTFKDIEIKTGFNVSLQNCSTDSLYIEERHRKRRKRRRRIRDEQEEGPIVVELDDTTINGNITFYGKPGVVKLKGSTKITGKVINGTIEK